MLSTTTLFLQDDVGREDLPEIQRPDGQGFYPLNTVTDGIITSINQYNPKMRVKEIRFVGPRTSFELMRECGSKFFGIIAETTKEDKNKPAPAQDDVWVEEQGEFSYWHHVVAYVFVVPETSRQGRNTLVSQQIFPSLFVLMQRNLSSPCMTLADHPAYLLDLTNEDHDAPRTSINRSFVSMLLSGIAVICPLHKGFELDALPTMTQYTTSARNDGYNNLEVDEACHTVKVLTNKDLFPSVKGSSEKFYTINVLGGIALAKRLGYRIDVSDLRTALEKVAPAGQQNVSKKYKRLGTVLRFIEKIEKGKGDA